MTRLNRLIEKTPNILKEKIFNLSDYIKADIFNLPNSYDDIKIISNSTKPDFILDVGAYVGDTVRKYRETLGDIPIHAFEPTKESYEKLVNNTKSLENVHTYNLGIANKEGVKKLFINNNLQTNSYLDNDEINNESLADHTKHVNTEEISVTTIDKWHKKYSSNQETKMIIKADVQGAEIDLIRGADHCLKNNVIALYTEVSLAPLYKNQADLFSVNQIMTSEYDYILFQIYRTRSDEIGRALWTDALWLHKDALEEMKSNHVE